MLKTFPFRKDDFEALVLDQIRYLARSFGSRLTLSDEADRLLEFGFQDDLDQIFRLLPKQRRTIKLMTLASSQLRWPQISTILLGLDSEILPEWSSLNYGLLMLPESFYSILSTISTVNYRNSMMKVQVKRKNCKTGEHQMTPDTLKNYWIEVPYGRRINTLRIRLKFNFPDSISILDSIKTRSVIAFLKKHAEKKIIVYFLTCSQVEYKV